MSDLGKCNLYNKTKGGGGGDDNPFHIVNAYGGIPQNLVTNLIGLTTLVLLFLILRKSAWKLVNKIVRKDDMERWTLLFFSFTTNVVQTIDQDIIRRSKKDRKDDQIVENNEPSTSAVDDVEDSDGIVAMEEGGQDGETPPPSPSSPPQVDSSYRSWLKSIFTASNDHILRRCGDDALQYLRFQRHVISYLVVITVLSICVILPLNFQGTLYGNVDSFEHTTLANLDPDSDYLWVHLFLSFLFFPMAILIMRRFSVNLKFTRISLEISRTVMIAKIPKRRPEQELITHFEEAFPQVEVTDLKLACDVTRLQRLSESLEAAKSAHRFCARNRELGRKPLTLYPARCARCFWCFCCCCVSKEDGLEFYGKEETRLGEEVSREREAALTSPLGIAFVTFANFAMSKEVFDAHQTSLFSLGHEPPHSSLSTALNSRRWQVTFAPKPDDIYWENLNVSSRFLTVKYAAVNVALFLFALFLTTPEVLLTQFNNIGAKLDMAQVLVVLQLPSYIVDFLPTLMVWGFTAFLPLLVSWSDRYLGHWTRSQENHSIMKKTFWYLLFMVVLLPTFGFTSLEAGIQFVFNSQKNETYRWECIFLPDSGAFFVNYAITAALVGAGLELIRFPDLLWYAVQLCRSRSVAETPHVRQSTKYEFRFGEQYARIMMLFCMTVVYCVSCPMITPFGTLYFVTKHYVDKHNLMYAYKPSKISKRVHSTAISFVILSTVMLQFFMMVFSLLRNGNITEISLRSKVAILLFLVSLNVFSAQLWADTCRRCSPIEYLECTYIRDDQHLEDSVSRDIYVPEVLMTQQELEEVRERKRASEIRRQRSRTTSNGSEARYGTF